MNTKTIATLALAILLAGIGQVNAATINFTGGKTDGSTYYEENGFRVDVIGGGGFFGDYYGAKNDVIHAHWFPGVKITITKIGGGTFDLNYFVLTSNTANGGGAASGFEQTYINASNDGGKTASYSQLLPPEDWGFPATSVFLGSQFDAVDMVWFSVTNNVFCFGMDRFFIDEPPPPSDTPEPASMTLLGLGLAGMAGYGWRRRKQAVTA